MKAGRSEHNTHNETVPCGREHSYKLECPSFTNNKVIKNNVNSVNDFETGQDY